jgi:hypothetical protein
MNEIYERWTAAHGVILLTPVHWYQASSAVKLMIDRLVCADGGNPDPTRTGGKDAARAKALELAGWPYPKHLAGRVYGVVVHGDVAASRACAARCPTGSTGWARRRRRGLAPGPLHRLLRAVRHQPRRAGPRRGGAGRDAQRRHARWPARWASCAPAACRGPIAS